MANSIHFNSTDLSTYGLTVTKTKWPLIATPKIDIQEVPYSSAVSQGVYYSPRKFNVNVIIDATSAASLETNISSINSVLNQTTEKILYFDNFRSSQHWLARYAGGLEDAEFVGISTMETTLEFIAPDPIAYSNTDTTSNVSITSTNHSFSLSDSTTAILGNTSVKPIYIIKLTNSGSGSVVLTNNTTSEALTINGSYASGHWLRVNVETMLVEKSTNSGSSYSNYMIGVSGTFPTLTAGSVNSFTITNVNSGGSILTTYQARYL